MCWNRWSVYFCQIRKCTLKSASTMFHRIRWHGIPVYNSIHESITPRWMYSLLSHTRLTLSREMENIPFFGGKFSAFVLAREIENFYWEFHRKCGVDFFLYFLYFFSSGFQCGSRFSGYATRKYSMGNFTFHTVKRICRKRI